MFIVLGELVVPVPRVPPSPSSPLTVCFLPLCFFLSAGSSILTNLYLQIDAKQARDLVNVLSESKQQIDPRLAEMARYSGGGGGGRWGGGGRGRGRGGGFTSSNAAPLGHGRRW